MKKVAFYTLGCKLNFAETSTLSRQFAEKGFLKVNFEDAPDIYLINTCSVTDNADKKCKKVVKEALKHNPNAFVAIVGCYAQLKPAEIANIPGVDAVLGAAEKFRLLDHIVDFSKRKKTEVFHSEVTHANTFVASYSAGDRTRTFLKVQDGCDYVCAFCTIPQARGKSRSQSIEATVKEAESAIKDGAKEIVLTGVNIGDYGIIEGVRQTKLIDLLEALDNLTGVERFRISSIEPNLLTDEIIAFVAGSAHFVPHFHIPLQSGSSTILAAMKRRYKREVYTDRVSKIKSLMPNCCIGVDVIVGFPGETEALFLETYQYLSDLDISYLHVFTYSERANTTAADMIDTVPASVRAQRSKMLHILSDKKRRAFYQSQLGTTGHVLFEADTSNGQMYGFTKNYVKVLTDYDPLLVNEVAQVTLTNINEDMLCEVDFPTVTFVH